MKAVKSSDQKGYGLQITFSMQLTEMFHEFPISGDVGMVLMRPFLVIVELLLLVLGFLIPEVVLSNGLGVID